MLIQRRLIWDIALTAIIIVALFVLLSTRSNAAKIYAKPLDVQKAQEIPESIPSPKIAIRLFPDELAGWNMQVSASNFRILPYEESTEEIASGLVFVSIDAAERIRLYGPWQYIPQLKEGIHTVEVSLHAQNFQVFSRNKSPVVAKFSVEVKGKTATVQKPN